MARFILQDKCIHYEEYGQGKPIVVLNGIMMSCGSWAEFVEPFSAHNRLILLDMLDQGKSDKMDGPFSQALLAEVVPALLDYLQLDKVNLLGISYGGEVAQRFAVKYGDRIERLVLFNTTSRTGPWLKDIGDGWNLAADDAESYYLSTIPIIYSPGFYRENNAWMEHRREVLRPGVRQSRLCQLHDPPHQQRGGLRCDRPDSHHSGAHAGGLLPGGLSHTHGGAAADCLADSQQPLCGYSQVRTCVHV